MRHFSLWAVSLVLALCGNAFAQLRLVQHNDQNDSCHRFKMVILTPADAVDHELPGKRFAGGVDSKMVWNPCATDNPQITFAPLVRPHRNDSLFPRLPWSFQRPAADNQMGTGGFVLAPLSFAFPRVWRRP